MRIAIDVVEARGHEFVVGRHRTTFEITKDPYLTPRGTCIIGIDANKSVSELSEELKRIAKSDTAIIVIVLEACGVRDVVLCRGSSKLVLGDERRIVIRRSRFIGPETLCIESNKAASDLSRELIDALRNGCRLVAKIVALDLGEVLTI